MTRPTPPHRLVEAAPDRESPPGSDTVRLLDNDPGHWYSEDELDAIERFDPELALRIDRAQHFAAATTGAGESDVPVDAAAVEQAVAEARQVLSQDGGDIELVGIDGRNVRVRMKGACSGCPNAALDLRQVVERMVRSRSPGVRSVVNVF